MQYLTRLLIFAAVLCLALLAVVVAFQRKMLFYPTHEAGLNGLAPWIIDGRQVGCARLAPRPANVWLFTYGNAGQASDRVYALSCFAPTDAVFFLEYPGYGTRPGSPGKRAIDAAALEGYRWLRKSYPGVPVCVAGESIGTGPAAWLAQQTPPPDKIVLVVPFDRLVNVARFHFPLLPASLFLRDRWDNVSALKGYRGRLEIFVAAKDDIIPPRFAHNLAQSLPGATLHEIPGGHNDWSVGGKVHFSN